MVVKAGFFKKTSCACSCIPYLQTCETRNKVYQLKNEEDGLTHFTESHQGLNKIKKCFEITKLSEVSASVVLDISIILHYARHR